MDDDILFADEAPEAEPEEDAWTILIVDDDAEVHSVTELALDGLRFSGRPLKFIHAYSGAEGCKQLEAHPETALMLLDVVMETDHAGLDVVEHVRNTLDNSFIRIILRTGQPGQAPELDVITRYDINDYKQKTELTRERLFTTIYTSLGVYRDLITLEANRLGLEKVIEASATVMEIESLERFAQGVLEQLTAIMFLGRDAVVLHASGVAANAESNGLTVLAGTGLYASKTGRDAGSVLPEDVIDNIVHAKTEEHVEIDSKRLIVVSRAPGHLIAFFVEADGAPSERNRRLIELFCRNVSIAWRRLQGD
ncbi:DUF3369 domain-containing protein [bacterium]|nr:DUF3369 domain-containing protein [bacterium]